VDLPAPDLMLSGDDAAVFASDVHLGEHATGDADPSGFLAALAHTLPNDCSHLFLLGDIFEFWAGDDLGTPGKAAFVDALAAWRRRAARPTALFVMHGNRDLLLGGHFLAEIQARLLSDPCTIHAFGSRVLLSHGDAWCTDDQDYQMFRREVRNPRWQQRFLELPPAERRARIDRIRHHSEAAKRGKSDDIMDVHPKAIEEAFAHSSASVIIHGHTHRPQRHAHNRERVRWVLPDWYAPGQRGGWLRVDRDAARAEGPYGRWVASPVEDMPRVGVF